MTEEKARAVLGTWKPYEYISTMPELIAAIASYGREVAAAEREECAKIADQKASEARLVFREEKEYERGCRAVAAAIRERGIEAEIKEGR